ncbi:MAG: glycosyltransferase family 1 protein [Cyanobacteria bacterium J149]|nr:MAG: glycosyltransferase family 1 protein [Cyanobacteria bacterium J149]
MKILSLPVDRSACGYYRIRKPLEGLRRYAGDETYVLEDKDFRGDALQDLIRALPEIDIIFMRPGAELGMRKLKQIIPNLKAKFVMDIDDAVDYVSPYSAFYKDFGTKEFKHEDMWVWKDGENGFDIQRNKLKIASLKQGLREADLVTVTTQKLAEYAYEFNPEVYINDNTIDFNHWWRLNNKINKPLKVIWQGSPSHYVDWYPIKDALNKLMDNYMFELYMLGSNYKGIFEKKHLSRVKTLPWVHFEAHSYRMMSIQADIGIIPLSTDIFNQYKSCIKLYENMAMGLPSVVSNVLPYSEVIEEGKNALGYKTPEEFYKKMELLLTNKGLRKNIANAGYQWVKKHKDLKDASIKLHERLEELIGS